MLLEKFIEKNADEPTASLTKDGEKIAVKSFSLFTGVDLQKLAGGEILIQRGSLMKFRRGISGESCCVVMKPSSTVAKFIPTSIPSKDEDKGVSFHVDIQLPVQAESFAGLELNSERRIIRRLIDRTMAATKRRPGPTTGIKRLRCGPIHDQK